MFLERLEYENNITYPRLFKKLYSCGAMDWLKHDYDYIRDNFDKISSDAKSFFAVIAFDCRPIPFRYVEEVKTEILESIKEYNAFADENKVMDPNDKIIPFSKTARGDVYCLFYRSDKAEPSIIRFQHDTCDLDIWNNSFEEFVFDELFNSVYENCVDIKDERVQFLLKFLNEDYQQKMIEYTPEKLSDYYKEVGLPKELNLFVDRE